MLHSLSWDTEYRQLHAGPFSSNFTLLEDETWFLLEEQSSRRVEIEAPSPTDMFVIALVEGEPAVVNGQTVSADHLFVQCPDSDFHATLPAGIQVTQVGIAAEYFEGSIHAISPGVSFPRTGVNSIPITPGMLRSIRQSLRRQLLCPSNNAATREEAVSSSLADAITVLANQSHSSTGKRLHQAKPRQAIKRAREYIEAHLDQAIRVESICRYSGTPLRTLERIFLRELGLSPQQYIKARRLNAVRRILLDTDQEQGHCITDVALSHGFSHLGRFAGDYRRYFGESPRETLLNR